VDAVRVNWNGFFRRAAQYAAGLVVMAMGVVAMKRVDLGISPITAVPAAVSAITPFSLGNMTIFLHALCVVGQILIVRRITLKSILTMLVGVPFGYIIDGLMWLFDPGELGTALRIILLIVGLALSGLGVQLVVGSDLMLPAPDELTHTISQVYRKKLGNVKIVSDAVYVAVALAVDLIFTRRVSTVGLGTLLSVLLTGRFIGWFGRLFPGLTMAPFWSAPRSGGSAKE
jgi:uncharacterized membrane protein YczE